MRKKLLIALGVTGGVLVIALVVYLVTIGKFSFLAAEGDPATLSLNPGSGSYSIGQTFQTQIILNTNGQDVYGADIDYLTYDPSLLEVQDSNILQEGIQISPGTIPGGYTGNVVDTTNGHIQIAFTPNANPDGTLTSFNGTGVLGTVLFKVLGEGTAAVNFYNPGTEIGCHVWGLNAVNILGSVTNGIYQLGDITPTEIVETATLSLSPNIGTYKVGDTFDVYVYFSTGSQPITAVYINGINYDPDLLEVQDSNHLDSDGVQIEPGIIFDSYTENVVDATTGKIKITGLQTQGAASFNGTERFAEITFVAKKTGVATLTFDNPGCSVLEEHTMANVLGTTIGGAYTIEAAPTTSPTATATPTATAIPTTTTSATVRRSPQSPQPSAVAQVTPQSPQPSVTPSLTQQEEQAKAAAAAEAERIRQARLSKTGRNTFILAGLIAIFLLTLIFVLNRRKIFKKHPNIKEMQK